MRGKSDLIYIDPPYDSKADYRTKITLPGGDIDLKPTVLEQFAYSDMWKDGTISYLKDIYPRLCLMKELLSEKGSIFVHLDWHIAVSYTHLNSLTWFESSQSSGITNKLKSIFNYSDLC